MKLSKRKVIWGLLFILLILAAIAYAARVPIGKALFERALNSAIDSNPIADLPDGLHVGICGSGSPMPDPTRAGPCTMVRAGKQIFIVDIGGGAARRLGEMRVQTGGIKAIFLTHFHSDHIDGLGELMLMRWTGGNAAPLPIYGGEGVETVVEGFNAAYAHDEEYRVAHHGADIMMPSGRGGTAMPINFAEGIASGVVYNKDGVVVTAFRVPHDPVSPALGYRFEYGGRSVVISGDTAKSDAVAKACNGCDILVHEALNKEMVGVMQAAFEKRGNKQLAKIMSDIPGYHTSPVEAAQIAKQGKAKMLVLTHIVPQLPTPLLKPYFLDGVSDAYGGTVKIAKDGEIYQIPAKDGAQ